MSKQVIKLTNTQESFIKYLKDNLSKENQIIYYNNNGHIGLDYAVCTHFRKPKILTFNELKQKKGKNILFRVLNILGAILALLSNHFNKFDTRTTVSTILNNMENIYLDINKENEFLKYLKIRKYSRRYIKPKFIVRIDEDDIVSSQDISCLKLLFSLIKNKKINNTILIVSGENMQFINIIKETHNIETYPSFELTAEDLKIISEIHEFSINYDLEKNIELVRKFGLQFFIHNYKYFDLLAKSQVSFEDSFKKIDWLINFMIKENKSNTISSKELFNLLEFSSFFGSSFSKLEIIKFNNNQLNAENLDVACNLAIIKKKQSENQIVPFFYFNIDTFKEYFYKKYCVDLQPLPQYIYEYFRKYLPFEFTSALKVLHVDSSFIDTVEQYSLIVLSYYYENETKVNINAQDFFRYTTKDSIPMNIIKIYEEFKYKKIGEYDNEILLIILNMLKRNCLDRISTCASYCFILQILKENFNCFPDVDFTRILLSLKSAILSIEEKDNYFIYWKTHYKCKYIAFSLEDENVDMSASRKFLREIENIKKNDILKKYIDMHNLRGFDTIELLSFSMGDDDSGKRLESLYKSAEESTLIKEIARINYSSFLLENKNYSEAEKLLSSANCSFLLYINLDTYCAYLNNFYLAQYKIKELSLEKYIILMRDLISKNVSFSDNLIILSNFSTACLMLKENMIEGEKRLLHIIKIGTPYSKFFATHNLLTFYYKQNNKEGFNKIYTQIRIPKLLRSETTFFNEKFEWLRNNIGKNIDFSKEIGLNFIPSGRSDMYLFSSIERWFE